jgi:hypothetical protein
MTAEQIKASELWLKGEIKCEAEKQQAAPNAVVRKPLMPIILEKKQKPNENNVNTLLKPVPLKPVSRNAANKLNTASPNIGGKENINKGVRKRSKSLNTKYNEFKIKWEKEHNIKLFQLRK